MKVGFISLGCAKNLVDTENIMGSFTGSVFEFEADPKKCDIIVINTCGFILSAKEETIDTILEIAEYKKKKLKKLIVCGCFVQRYFEDCLQEFPEVDRFIKIEDYPRLKEILSETLEEEIVYGYGQARQLVSKPHMAYLRISDGCDNRCAYCAIPLIRGNCRSVEIETLVSQAKELKEKGVKELTVIAQDTTYYGYDLYHRFALKDLLKELDKLGFEWIRVLYMYPDEIDDELLETMKSMKSFVPYFDIPIQYGDDEILRWMNRRGNTALIKAKIDRIREIFPEACLRTTVMTGFPHETEESFLRTLSFIKEIGFDSLGAFEFSREEDTKAYEMDEEVSEEDAHRRYEILMEAQQQIVEKKQKSHVGQTLKVIVESYEEIFDDYVCRSYLSAPDGVDGNVYVKSEEPLEIGSFINVKITDYKDYDLYGRITYNEEKEV